MFLPGNTKFPSRLTHPTGLPIIPPAFGAWLSLVERTVRDREVGGSNPLAPTNLTIHQSHTVVSVNGLFPLE